MHLFAHSISSLLYSFRFNHRQSQLMTIVRVYSSLFPYSPYLDVFVVLRFVAGVLSLSLSLSHTHTPQNFACESSHLIEFKLTDHIATSVFEYIVRYRKGHRAQTSSVCSLLCRESIERIVLDPAGSFLKSFLSYSLFSYT